MAEHTTPELSRRHLLAAVGAGAFLLPLAARTRPAAAAETDEYELLLQRAEELMTGGEIDPSDPDYAQAIAALDAEASELWATMDQSAGRTALWPDLTPATDPAMFGQSYPRLKDIAIAWATPGTSLHGRDDVAAVLVDALRFLHDSGYNVDGEGSGNWWFWEMGAPRGMLDTCVLLRDQVPDADLVDYLATAHHFVPDANGFSLNPDWGPMTGANRADKCVTVALQGLLGRDSAKLESARDSLSDVQGGGEWSLFKYVTSGDGFYTDGSFVQHSNVAYTGTYGNVTLAGTAYILALLGSSSWEVTDPDVGVIYDSIERSFAPVIFDGLMMSGVRGRAVSREGESGVSNANSTISNALLYLVGAPQEYAERWRPLLKGWITRRQESYPYTGGSIPRVTWLKDVLDESVPTAERTTGHFVFADMDRVVHRRPEWAFAVSLSSERIAAYECGNDENLHAWYQGDGATYFYVPDALEQYADGYGPTVDPYRLPGTTVDTRQREDVGEGQGTRTYVPTNKTAGGAALDERFGAAAMNLIADGSTLKAKKAWFSLDDAVIALGADIDANDGRTIETIIENRNLLADGTATLTINGRPQPGQLGWSGDFDTARWAHLDGVGGYVVLGGSSLNALRQERTGRWSDVNQGSDTGGSDDEVTRRYVTLWLDHGISPTDASYAYILLPGASPAKTRRWAASNPARIVANNSDVQAIESRRDGLIAAHFWAASEAAGLACSGTATVLVRRRDDGISVAVADSSRTEKTVTVELPFPATSVHSADDTVSVELGKRPVLTVSVDGSRGHTHTAKLV